MNCEHVRENLAAFIDGELDEPDIAGVQEHLESCKGCQKELEELRRTARALEGFLEPKAMGESVADGVLATLASERGRRGVLLRTKAAWALTGAAAAVLILVVFGLLGLEGGGEVAFADELVDEALADHTETFDIFKKQVIHSTANDPTSEVRIIRADLRISGLRKKTARLEKLLECSNHPQKSHIKNYIISVHRLMNYVENPPLESEEAIIPALRKTAMNIAPLQATVVVQISGPVEADFAVPKNLDDEEKNFVEGKGYLYRGNFAKAAKAFKLVVKQAPESHIGEVAKYFNIIAEINSGTHNISIESKGEGLLPVPVDPGLREEIRKDFEKWIKPGGPLQLRSERFDLRMQEWIEKMGKKIGVHIETTQDKEGNTVIKMERKDDRGNSAKSVIKVRGAGKKENK